MMNTKSYNPHSVRVVAGATLLSALVVACGGLEPDVGTDPAGLETLSRVYVTPQVVNGVFTVHGDDELVPGNTDGLDDDTQVVVMEIPAEPRNFDTHADFAYFLLGLGGAWTEDATLAEGVVDLELEETGPIYSEAFEGTEGLLEIDDAFWLTSVGPPERSKSAESATASTWMTTARTATPPILSLSISTCRKRPLRSSRSEKRFAGTPR